MTSNGPDDSSRLRVHSTSSGFWFRLLFLNVWLIGIGKGCNLMSELLALFVVFHRYGGPFSQGKDFKFEGFNLYQSYSTVFYICSTRHRLIYIDVPPNLLTSRKLDHKGHKAEKILVLEQVHDKVWALAENFPTKAFMQSISCIFLHIFISKTFP